jgi:hypothetical protein
MTNKRRETYSERFGIDVSVMIKKVINNNEISTISGKMQRCLYERVKEREEPKKSENLKSCASLKRTFCANSSHKHK